jgi:hypothetical protein
MVPVALEIGVHVAPLSFDCSHWYAIVPDPPDARAWKRAVPSVDMASTGSEVMASGVAAAPAADSVIVWRAESTAAVMLLPALRAAANCENTVDEKSWMSPVECLWEPPTSAPFTVSDPPTVALPEVLRVFEDSDSGRACE